MAVSLYKGITHLCRCLFLIHLEVVLASATSQERKGWTYCLGNLFKRVPVLCKLGRRAPRVAHAPNSGAEVSASNVSGACAVRCLGIPWCRRPSGFHLCGAYGLLLRLLPCGPSCGSRGLCWFHIDIVCERGPGGRRRRDNAVTLIGGVSVGKGGWSREVGIGASTRRYVWLLCMSDSMLLVLV